MKPKTVLLVEDDYLDVISVKRALSKLNVEHALHIAHNGADALELLNGNTPGGGKIVPDVILLDLNMPKMNGIEFLGIIKNYSNLKNIKVFITTTSAEEYDKAAAEKYGVSGYILKPLDFENSRKNNSSAAIASLKYELLMA